MKTVSRIAGIALVLIAFSHTATFAEPPDWSYLEAGYLNVDPDAFSGSGDNWFAGGSIGFLKHFHFTGRYLNGDVADGVDQTIWRLGLGWHGLLGEKADVVAGVDWLDTEVNNIGDDGYQVIGGVRWRFVKLLELEGYAKWADLSDAGSDDSYEGRAMIHIWRLAFGASYETSSDADQWNGFVRFNFPK